MKRMFLFGSLMIAGVFLSFGSASAASIQVVPSSQDVLPGASVAVDIEISGLGNGSPPSLGAFDLDLQFDASVLSLQSVTFGNQLDVLGLGSLSEWSESVAGQLNMWEVSIDLPWDLHDLQAGAFVLASLSFDAIGAGSSALGLSINALGDALGNPLQASVTSGTVNVIPEPSAVSVFGTGIFLIALAIRQQRRGASKPHSG